MSDAPPSARPLAPYIRSRQEVRRIRQALTLYLQSHIVSADNASADSLLAGGFIHADVPKIPANLTGARKEYLHALQENAAAKREYDDLSHKIASRKLVQGRPSTAINQGNQVSPLEDYLSLLRENRRYEKLRLFDSALADLSKEAPADIPVPEQDALLGQWRRNASARESAEDVQDLISKLERTVLRAKENLAREQHLLEELKARQQSVPPRPVFSARREAALQRVRHELVQWVEEKLATANPEDVPAFDVPSEPESTDSLHVTERKALIREQYVKYVQERSTLLDALSLLSQPTKSVAPAPEQATTKKPPDPRTTPSWNSVDLFGPALELLLPGSAVQKSLALQRSYLAGLLSKEKANLSQSLDRLSHESHLLPEYPILARQTRFKHITADRADGERADELVVHAQAWAFAADAARSNESDYVEQKIEHGQDQSQAASRTLQQIYDMLNQDNPATTDGHDHGDPDDEDIWTAAVESRSKWPQQRDQGPWARLHGRLG
ncbi:hypothetical protein PISL3812_09243 [Talaromyces islandicus]|uniref:Uncharacterized protein n=1 Tax=Talaromyces islandicus TaxID=28573 RepID=A0A0U1M9A8_TALIS|nr:hypothetical protein PISL3812_09243 [Talaromyces islandicus]